LYIKKIAISQPLYLAMEAYIYCTCFYKHMTFWNQARLYLAIYNFEVHIMLSLC